MSYDPLKIAKQIFEQLALAKITNITTCMTRLRINLDKLEIVNIEKLKSINGVLGVIIASEQLQIIIGPGKVNQVYQSLSELISSSKQEQSPDSINNLESVTKLSDPILPAKTNVNHLKGFLKRLANIFVPIIPAFIGCGLVLGLLNIFVKAMPVAIIDGLAFEQTTIGILLRLIGNAIGYGLAIFVGINAAKEFGGTPILGGVLATLINMPELTKITVFGEHAVPGRGGVIAILFIAGFAAFLEKKLRKIIPVALDLFLTPTLVLLVTGITAIFILQPLGGVISDAITNGSKLALEHGGPLVGFILSAAFLPLVMTGLHQGLIPIHAELIQTTGSTVLLPILAMAGAGQVGASLAVWLRTQNLRLRHIIKSSILVGFLGVGEPLIYGVTLPLLKPFIAACIGGGMGGAFVAYFKLGATGIGISGLPLALLIVNGPLLYIAGIIISYLGGFLTTLLIGFDDSVFE